MKFLNFIKRHIVVSVILVGIVIATIIGVIKVTASTISIVPSVSSITVSNGSQTPIPVSCSSTISKDNGETEVWSWTSDDENVVSAAGGNGSGTVYPKKAGKSNVNITVELINPSTGEVTASETTRIPVTVGIAIDSSTVEGIMVSGGSAIVTCNGCTEHPVEWSSSNDNIVSVVKDSESAATLSFVSGGIATITASIGADSLATSFVVTVGVSINEDTIEVKQGETKAVSTNSNSASDVFWWSADEEVATVENGNITGVYAGTTTIYGSCIDLDATNNAGDSVVVSVPYEVSTVDTTVTIGDQISLTTTANPEDVNFYSESNNIVTYNSTTGKFDAVNTGTAIIHAIWNGNDTAYTITVIDGFSISTNSMYLNIGETGTIVATSTNNDPANPIHWSVGDETIATIETSDDDNTGDTVTVTALATGSTTLVATQTINGVVKTCTCTIYVLNPVTSLTLLYNGQEINDTITVQKGTGVYITAYLNIEDGLSPDNTTLSWVSSDTSIITVEPATTAGQQQLCRINAVDGGTATITVVTDDGLFIKTANFYVSEGVTGITIDKTDVTAQMALEKYQLKATVTPDTDGVDKSVVWSSLDTSVVTVDQNGLVTFVGPGSTYVLATSVADPNYQASCRFLITQQVEDVKMDYDSVTMNVGEEFRLSALITPMNATNQNLIWSSSNEAVVVVDETGLLTAKSSGSATIIVQTEDGGYIDMTNVTVLQPVTSITLSETEKVVRKGTVFYLDAICNPDSADDKRVTWSSSDTSLATVDQNGKVTTLAVGSVTISCTSNESGVIAYCLVDITEPVTGLKLNSYHEEILKGTKFVIIPTVLPIDAFDKSVTFTSADPAIATVDEIGVVTGVAPGTVDILVTTNESKLTKTCTFVVTELVETIEITGAPEVMKVGETAELEAIVGAETASNKIVSWTSNNPRVATVDAEGNVTAISEGVVFITATATDGSEVTASVSIQVINPVKEIILSDSLIEMYVGETKEIYARINPSTATISKLVWSCDDESIAKIYEDGDIEGIAPGRTIIRAKTTDGTNLEAICTIIVKEYVETISITGAEETLFVGDSMELGVTVTKDTATDKTVRWSSSNNNIATVDSEGKVTGVSEGDVVITAIASDGGGASASVIIHVINPVKEIHLNESRIEIYVGDTYNLVATLNPKDASIGELRWTSDDESIAKVYEDGDVVGMAVGRTMVRVYATDGSDTVAKCTVIVKERPAEKAIVYATKVTLNSSEITMLKGKTRKLTANLYPRNCDETINWISSDTSVVQVDPYGNIVTVGAGTATVTAYSTFGTTQATCIVHSIAMHYPSIGIEQYDTFNLYVDGAPSTVSFRTSNPRIATVDSNGLVTARMPGECIISATVDNKTVTTYVKVYRVDPNKFINVNENTHKG